MPPEPLTMEDLDAAWNRWEASMDEAERARLENEERGVRLDSLIARLERLVPSLEKWVERVNPF